MSYTPSIDLGLPLQVRSFPPLSSFNAPHPPAVVGRTLLSSARRPSIDADAVVAVVGYLSITTYQHAPPSSSSDPPSPCAKSSSRSSSHSFFPSGRCREASIAAATSGLMRRRSDGSDTRSAYAGGRNGGARERIPSSSAATAAAAGGGVPFPRHRRNPRNRSRRCRWPSIRRPLRLAASHSCRMHHDGDNRDPHSWTRPRSSSSFSRIASPSSTITDRKAMTTSGLARIRCVPPECLCRMSIVVGSPSSSHLLPSCQGIMFAQ
jgi:hypothetical protein